MSLIRFLSFGSRGLTKGAPPMGRYRLPNGSVIPNFGAGKNPFTSSVLSPQKDSSPAAGATARAASTQAAPPSPAPSPGALRTLAAEALVRAWLVLRVAVSRLRSVWVQCVQCGRGLPARLKTRLPGRGGRIPFASSVSPQAARPVQGELTLENVRVVRNDLTDTDYEVVCSETTTASPVKRVPQTVPVVTEPGALGRLAERLFSQKTS